MKITQDPYFRMTHDVAPQLCYKKPAKMDEKYKTFNPRSLLNKENIIFMKTEMLHSIYAYDLKINQKYL